MHHSIQKRIIRLLLFLRAALLVSCTQRTDMAPAIPVAAEPARESGGLVQEIVIDNFAFSPPTVTIAAGTRVVWLNRDDVPHTATSSSKPKRFDTGALDTDDRYAHVFSEPGTYEYYCAVHPKMTGQIIVK